MKGAAKINASPKEPTIARVTTLQKSATTRQFVIFSVIGAANTLLYFVVFNLLRLGMGAYAANALAVAVSITFSFWANRRFTFQYAGAHRGLRQFTEFAFVFVVTLIVSSAALWMLFRVVDDATVVQENVALIVSSAVLVVVRFWFMKRWVFDPER